MRESAARGGTCLSTAWQDGDLPVDEHVERGQATGRFGAEDLVAHLDHLSEPVVITGPARTVETMTDELVAATDGSALGNPGPGGWCWWVSDECWAAGSNKHTTNNIMEIQAVYELLVSTREAGLAGHRLEIQADSRYVIDALTKWIFSWKDNEWMTAKKEPVKNRELFEATFEEMQGRAVRLSWVRGHMGHRGNEAADKRARLAATQAKAGKTVLLGPGA